MINEYGAVGGIIIGREVLGECLFVYHKIPHDLIWDRTRATKMGSRRLTASAMTRSKQPNVKR
jgi:hypothetical protein